MTVEELKTQLDSASKNRKKGGKFHTDYIRAKKAYNKALASKNKESRKDAPKKIEALEKETKENWKNSDKKNNEGYYEEWLDNKKKKDALLDKKEAPKKVEAEKPAPKKEAPSDFSVQSTGSNEAIGGGQSQNPSEAIDMGATELENLKSERDFRFPLSEDSPDERNKFSKDYINPAITEQGGPEHKSIGKVNPKGASGAWSGDAKAKPMPEPVQVRRQDKAAWEGARVWAQKQFPEQVFNSPSDLYSKIGTMVDMDLGERGVLVRERLKAMAGAELTANSDEDRYEELEGIIAKEEEFKSANLDLWDHNGSREKNLQKFKTELSQKDEALDLYYKDFGSQAEQAQGELPQGVVDDGSGVGQPDEVGAHGSEEQPGIGSDLNAGLSADNPIAMSQDTFFEEGRFYEDQAGNIFKAKGSGQDAPLADWTTEFEKVEEGIMNPLEQLANQRKMEVQAYREGAKQRKEDILSLVKESAQNIDPQRYISSMSTGQSIAVGLSMLGSAMAAANLGTTDTVLNIVNKAIEADVDAQKTNLDAKRKQLGYLKKLDEDEAEKWEEESLTLGMRQLRSIEIVQRQILGQAQRASSKKQRSMYMDIYNKMDAQKMAMTEAWGNKFTKYFIGKETAEAAASSKLALKQAEAGIKLNTAAGKEQTATKKDLDSRYDNDESIKSGRLVMEKHASMRELLGGKTAVGDHAAIVGYLKIIDPRSVARSDEVKGAAHLGNLINRAEGWWTSIFQPDGRFISSGTRKQFLTIVDNMAQKSLDSATKAQQRFNIQGQRRNLKKGYFNSYDNFRLTGRPPGKSGKLLEGKARQ